MYGMACMFNHLQNCIFRENERLKEQLRHYMSAVEIGKALKSDNGEGNEEIDQYEKKLVQVGTTKLNMY